MVRVLAFAVFLALLGSCQGSSCSEIGCQDSAYITITTLNGEWAAGEYDLLVVLDGVEHACSFTMPDDLSRGAFECEPSLSALFVPRVTCTEHDDGDGFSQTCTPIPNQFDIVITVLGTPAAARVELARDGALLVDEAHTLEYRQSSPNGPECSPHCDQASLAIQIQ